MIDEADLTLVSGVSDAGRGLDWGGVEGVSWWVSGGSWMPRSVFLTRLVQFF